MNGTVHTASVVARFLELEKSVKLSGVNSPLCQQYFGELGGGGVGCSDPHTLRMQKQ